MIRDEWEIVSSRARAILNYGIAQREWLEESRLAKFIAAIPYLAQCGKARETSFSHLLIYLASLDGSVKELFFHKPEDDDDLYSRLRPILNFKDGNQATLDCCKDLLALCMVANYQRTAETDMAVGKYNPLNTGIWDAKSLMAGLEERIRQNNTPEIAAYFSLEEARLGPWQE